MSRVFRARALSGPPCARQPVTRRTVGPCSLPIRASTSIAGAGRASPLPSYHATGWARPYPSPRHEVPHLRPCISSLLPPEDATGEHDAPSQTTPSQNDGFLVLRSESPVKQPRQNHSPAPRPSRDRSAARDRAQLAQRGRVADPVGCARAEREEAGRKLAPSCASASRSIIRENASRSGVRCW